MLTRKVKLLFLVFLAAGAMGCSLEELLQPDDSSQESSQDQPVEPPQLIVPYLDSAQVTYIQPFGVPLDFGGGDIRPHAAVDFGCPDSVEFRASASGILGDIWLNYPHSYQFNIVVNDSYVVHYCMEPVNIADLTDQEKMDAIYFAPGDSVHQGESICIMAGGGGHLDWGLIRGNERICPACYLTDEQYTEVNAIFHSRHVTFEGYNNLCPDNQYHENPRP